jgi:hypothetical protein
MNRTQHHAIAESKPMRASDGAQRSRYSVTASFRTISEPVSIRAADNASSLGIFPGHHRCNLTPGEYA